jgi:hypothetical protein
LDKPELETPTGLNEVPDPIGVPPVAVVYHLELLPELDALVVVNS